MIKPLLAVILVLSVILLVGCINFGSPKCKGNFVGAAFSDNDCSQLCGDSYYAESCLDGSKCYCNDQRQKPVINETKNETKNETGAYEVDERGLRKDIDYNESDKKTEKKVIFDWDNDTLNNTDEVKLGTDPYSYDTDGDGLSDGYEVSRKLNPLNPDTDNDGINDGKEIELKTDPFKQDTDSDGLTDLEEINNGLIPTDPDSENDGLMDGKEVDWGADTDNDGKINALDADSDNDGLTDSAEMQHSTSMLLTDSDGDTLTDYEEVFGITNPLKKDTDDDGLTDAQENHGGQWKTTDLQVSKIQPKTITMSLTKGTYQPMFRTLPSNTLGINLKTTATGCISVQEQFEILSIKDGFSVVSVPRWFSLKPFTVNNDCDLTLTFEAIASQNTELIIIDSVAAVKLDANKTETNPLSSDTDLDGVKDANEASLNAYWFEAEHYALNDSMIINKKELSNAKGIATDPSDYGYHTSPLPGNTTNVGNTTGTTYFPANSSICQNNICVCTTPTMCYVLSSGFASSGTTLLRMKAENVESGTYALFIRGYGKSWPKLDVRVSAVDRTIIGAYEVDGSMSRGKWTPVYYANDSDLSFKIKNETDVTIEIVTNDQSANAALMIDKILLVKMTYSKPPTAMTYAPAPMPRLLTDPLNPDTDGDGYRFRITQNNNDEQTKCKLITEVYGYLTDKFELDKGLNPMSIDTDRDSQADDVDANPWGQDADDDGIADSTEDANLNMVYDDFEISDWCNPDTDYDRVIDGNENWNYDSKLDAGETDPKHIDTDRDGLLDGSPTLSQGFLNDSYSYKISINSARFRLFNSTLAKLYFKDKSADPWIINNDGTATFIGELEKNTDPLKYDSDSDGLPDGVEIFIYKTNPAKEDTDNDGKSDGVEVNRGTDPLVPDLPDLQISSFTIYPEEYQSNDYFRTDSTFTVFIMNNGKDQANGKIRVTATAYGKTLEKTVWDLAANDSFQLDFDLILTSDVYFDYFNGAYYDYLVFKPGNNTVKIIIDSQNPPQGWERVIESDYSNNKREDIVLAKGQVSPSGTLLISNSMIVKGDAINLTYSATDIDGYIRNYEIDFEGDGVWDYSSANAKTIEHTYLATSFNGTQEKRFKPALRITDDDNYQSIVYSRELTVFPSAADDTDKDGLTDQQERITYGTDYLSADSDGDYLTDYEEVIKYKTNATKFDTDGDGMNDRYEIVVAEHFGLLNKDVDSDGLMPPFDADSDNDGLKDGAEFKFIMADQPYYIQEQYLYNIRDYWAGTNPFLADSDADGIDDYTEQTILRSSIGTLHQNLNPLSSDTDSDGLDDYQEVYLYGTKSDKADSDNDGLQDGLDMQPLSFPTPILINTSPVKEWSGDCGTEWATIYPVNMLRFETDAWLWGLDGRSYDNWINGEITPEGICTTEITDEERVKEEVGLGDNYVKIYSINELVPQAWENDVLHSHTDLEFGRYTIDYYLKSRKVHFKLKNLAPCMSPAKTWYTLWEVALEPNANNSIEIQFSIDASQDLYPLRDVYHTHLPAFQYKLYEKGAKGMEFISTDAGRTYDYLVNNDADPVYYGVAHASEMKTHYYRVEMRLPANKILSSNMYLVISPVWLEYGEEIVPIDPHYIGFQSLSKIIYSSDNKAFLRVGYDAFQDLQQSIITPTVWNGQRNVSFTRIDKTGEDEYKMQLVTQLKKARHMGGSLMEPFYVYEQVIFGDVVTANGGTLERTIPLLSNSEVRNKLFSSEVGSLLMYNPREIVFEDPLGLSQLGNEAKWLVFGGGGELAQLIPGVGQVFGVVISLGSLASDLVIETYNYEHTDNPLYKKQAAENIEKSIVSFGIGLIPGWFFVEAGWKGIVYGVVALTGNDISGEIGDIKVERMADPIAFAQFWDQYFTLEGDIPTDISIDVWLAAHEKAMREVDIKRGSCPNGTCMHIYMPPPAPLEE